MGQDPAIDRMQGVICFIGYAKFTSQPDDGPVYEKIREASRNHGQWPSGRSVPEIRLLGARLQSGLRLLRDNHAVLHGHDSVGMGRQFVVMSHDDEGCSSRTVQLTEERKQGITGMAIEVARRLVGKDEVRLLHQSARDGNPLLFTAGEFPRLMMETFAQADFAQELCRFARDIRKIALLDHGREARILQGCEFGQQMVKLKDEPDPSISKFCLLLFGELEEILPFERHRALRRTI